MIIVARFGLVLVVLLVAIDELYENKSGNYFIVVISNFAMFKSSIAIRVL